MEPYSNERKDETILVRDVQEFGSQTLKLGWDTLVFLVCGSVATLVGFSMKEASGKVIEGIGLGCLVWGMFSTWRHQRRQVREQEQAVGRLTAEIASIKKPRFEIECGHGTTQLNGSVLAFRKKNLLTGEVAYPERHGLALFGFRLWNRGAFTAKKCRVTLIAIEKDRKPICSSVGALPFESKNQGDDLEEVDLPNDVPQPVAVFSIFHEGDQIAAGTANLKWRHAPIHNLFSAVGEYEFVVSISYQPEGNDVTVTQRERFTFLWRGTYLGSAIEYRGPNKYTGLTPE